MKIEDSGMPEEIYWNSLFNIDEIVDWLNLSEGAQIVEMGSGYGTFTVPIGATLKRGSVVTASTSKNP